MEIKQLKMEERANLQMGYEIRECWYPILNKLKAWKPLTDFSQKLLGGETENKMKIQNVENLLSVEFVYHFHLFAVPLKKTIQRELKHRAKLIFMRNCPYQLILFLYWAIVLPQICSFDIYIYISLLLFTTCPSVRNHCYA